MSLGDLVTQWHTLEFVEKPPPIVRQHLRVLDALLSPVLIPAGDVILCGLESDKLVTDTLLDENRAVMLIDDGFFVLLKR